MGGKLGCLVNDTGKTVGAGGNAVSLQGREKIRKECVLKTAQQAVAFGTEGREPSLIRNGSLGAAEDYGLFGTVGEGLQGFKITVLSHGNNPFLC